MACAMDVTINPAIVATTEPQSGDATSGVTSSSETSEAEIHPPKPPTKRSRPTYYVRKEQAQELSSEVDRLQAHIRALESVKRQRMSAELGAVAAVTTNAALQGHIWKSHLAIAGAQSMLSSYAHSPEWQNPLQTYIHLTTDAAERRATLMALRDEKLRQALEFLLVRTSCLDPRRSYRQEDTFQLTNGDHILMDFSMRPLEGAKNVKQVYDAVQLALQQEEFNVTDKLGVTTIRDSDGDDAKVSQQRLLSTHAENVDVEANTVRFCQFVEQSDQLAAPHGLVVVDFVDQDDLYPYQPQTRIRKDVTVVGLVCAIPHHCGDGGGDGSDDDNDGGRSDPDRSSIFMVQWSCIRVRKPECKIPRSAETRVRRDLLQWCHLMGDVVQDVMMMSQDDS